MKEYLSNVLEILEEKGVLNESYDLEFKSAKGGASSVSLGVLFCVC